MLIKCPECSGDVSSAAISCPKCGHPIAAASALSEAPIPIAEPQTDPGKVIAGWIAIIAVVVVSGVIYANISSSSDTVAGASATPEVAPPEDHNELVRTIAGGPTSSEQFVGISAADAIKSVAVQIAGAQYNCGSISQLWMINFAGDAGGKIFKARCSNGSEYQVTFLRGLPEGHVKPWTGNLLGP